MPSADKRTTTHETEIGASADAVYGIVADAARWPLYFAPNLHVEQTPLDGSSERLHIWALANEEVKSWTSRRDLDPGRRTVVFRQEKSAPPVLSMGGVWQVSPTPGGSRLTLTHEFEAEGEDGAEWLTRATERNSSTELSNIKALAERWEQYQRAVSTFEDSVLIDGPADAVYDFLQQAGRWEERLPHVSRMELSEDSGGVQLMTMETLTRDGDKHTTESVRVCFPDERRIVYKQIATPPLMAAHTGEWTVRETGDGVLATSKHTVVVEESAVGRILGEDADVDSALSFLRTALGQNSTSTLNLAKEFAEVLHA